MRETHDEITRKQNKYSKQEKARERKNKAAKTVPDSGTRRDKQRELQLYQKMR